MQTEGLEKPLPFFRPSAILNPIKEEREAVPMTELLRHAEEIYGAAIRRALPDAAVKEALKAFRPGPGRTLLVSVGKAAWRMASP